MKMTFLVVVFASLIYATAEAAGSQAYYHEAFVFPRNTFAYNHCSSLAEVKPGEVFITWFAGSAEIAADAQIYGVRSLAAAEPKYSEPSMIVQKQDKAN